MRRFFCYTVLLLLAAQTSFVAADVHSAHQEHSIETHHHTVLLQTASEDEIPAQYLPDNRNPEVTEQDAGCTHCCHCHGHFGKVAAAPIKEFAGSFSSVFRCTYRHRYQLVRAAPKLRPPIA